VGYTLVTREGTRNKCVELSVVLTKNKCKIHVASDKDKNMMRFFLTWTAIYYVATEPYCTIVNKGR
jgi:hypothetical protein